MADSVQFPKNSRNSARPRRILATDDFGEDVRLIQRALNGRLNRFVKFPIETRDWRTLSEWWTPELWGYYWTRNSLKRFAKHRGDLYKRDKTSNYVKRSAPIKEDGRFGGETEKAVLKYQHKAGLPEDGMVGPDVWEHLFPFWILKVVILAEKAGSNTPGADPSVPASGDARKKVLVGSPFGNTELDNIANQMALQTDKDGLTKVFVLQATWKTDRQPQEIIPGHWEHTGGIQVNTPANGGAGKNIQAFYQLTRADLFTLELGEKTGLAGDLWVQPTIQAPIDKGTPANPNVAKVGATTGATVSLEFKGDEGQPTMKIFVQGGYGISVDRSGKFDKGAQALVGVSAEFDADTLFGGKPARSAPAQALGMTIDPGMVTLLPGKSASVKVTTTKTLQETSLIYVSGLPPGVTANPASISKFSNSGTVIFQAQSNAPYADFGGVTLGVDFSPPGSKSMAGFVSGKLRVVVQN